jgi:predicted Rossmann fold nucleotide-binding protein DprA/Smf involved in DNA uptake
MVGERLVRGLTTVDELVASTGLPVASVLAALTMLETRGLVIGAYGRYRPAGRLAGRPTAVPTPR